MVRALMVAIFCAGLLVSPALAQDVDATGFDNPEFQTFLGSDYMNRIRRENLQRSVILHTPECVETPEFEIVDTWPVDQITMVEGAQVPTEGIWRERLLMTACGESAVENMVHTFTEEGQRTFLLVRGTTEADLATQFNLIGEAREAVANSSDAQGCDIIRFTDTSILNRYGPTRWGERWTANACGRSVRLDIVFDSVAGSDVSYTITLAH